MTQPAAAPADARAPELDEERDRLLDQLRRERADFLNYRRRVDRDRLADRDRARGEVVTALVPLLDDLERAFARVPDALLDDPWVAGVALSRHRVADALHDAGVERIGEEGEPFDPALHEAVFHEGRPGVRDPVVAIVIRPGYRIGDQLLRPAQVSVLGPVQGESQPQAAEAGNGTPAGHKDGG